MAKPPLSPIVNADPAPEKFKQFRSSFDFTQAQAATLLGVSVASWQGWERGQRPQVAARLLVTLLVAKPELLKLLLEQDGSA